VSDAKARLQMPASPQKSARSPRGRKPSGVSGIAIDVEADAKPADATQALKLTLSLTAGQASGQDAVHGGCVVAMPPTQLGQQAADADVAHDVTTVSGTPPLSSSIDGCLPAQEEAHAAAPEAS